MKLPNGYGSITKLKGKRRRPFMIREGKSKTQKIIGYASTQQEALKILAEYNGVIQKEVKKSYTFQQFWDLFLEKRAKKLGEGTIYSLKAVVRYCT